MTAFLLNLSDVVPDNFTLSDKNMAEVQARMPNRNGMTTDHAMWPGSESKCSKTPDVKNTDCTKDCAPNAKAGAVPGPDSKAARQQGGKAARPTIWPAKSSPAAPACGARSPCRPQSLGEADARAIALWLASGSAK